MYLGSKESQTESVFINKMFTQKPLISGLLKTVFEIIDNSVDEHIRTGYKHANKIDVIVNNNIVTVADNGRGFPAVLVNTPDGKEEYKMVAAFSRARAGSNFDDSVRVTAGMNGVGSFLTNVMSTKFEAISGDGKKEVTMTSSKGVTADVRVKVSSRKGTIVKFTPDFEFFGVECLDAHHIEMIEERIKALSLAFPTINFRFNTKPIKVDFAGYFGDCNVFNTDTCSFGITKSDGTFQTSSIVNGLVVKDGSHIDYIYGSIIDTLIDSIKRKKGIELTKARVK
jgi:DNA topoisomerase-2